MKVKVKLTTKYGQKQSMLIETVKTGTKELQRIENFLKTSFKPSDLELISIK